MQPQMVRRGWGGPPSTPRAPRAPPGTAAGGEGGWHTESVTSLLSPSSRSLGRPSGWAEFGGFGGCFGGWFGGFGGVSHTNLCLHGSKRFGRVLLPRNPGGKEMWHRGRGAKLAPAVAWSPQGRPPAPLQRDQGLGARGVPARGEPTLGSPQFPAFSTRSNKTKLVNPPALWCLSPEILQILQIPAAAL